MMNQSKKIVAVYVFGGMLIVAGLWTSGCADPAEQMRERLGTVGDIRLHKALRSSIAVTGSIENWATVERIEGDALATVFEPDGEKVLVEQQHQVIPGDNLQVSVTSNEPGGALQELLDRKGRVRLLLQGQGKDAPPTEPDELRGTNIKLRLLAQALTGPAGLLRKGYQLRYDGLERKGGRLMHKIVITGPILGDELLRAGTNGNLLVVWIDAQTSLVNRWWLRYQREKGKFGYLAVNVDKYQKTPEGLMLPHYISFIRSDKYQQFSERQLLLFEYHRLRVIQK